MKSRLELFHSSPFFEVFEEEHLTALAEHAKMETFTQGATIVREDQDADHMYMLVIGRVRLLFEVPVDEREEEESETYPDQVFVRTIDEPGRILGWSAMVEPYHYRATAVALDDTQLLSFERDWLDAYAEEHPTFGVRFMERILWVLGNRLRESRIRLVARRYEQEVLSIRALLDQSAEQLPVTSPLHKIPHYLENRLTFSDAIQTLELLQVHGDELERNLAGLCLDILEGVKKELGIYQQLQTIYEHVASAPMSASPERVRDVCCMDFSRLFEKTAYVVLGKENLPATSGHIFIMNHLDNHPDNALPNDFRLTLDTHFVSSMILWPKYGQSPIRVIRKSRPDEYGHQKYYDRMGYIYVYAGHVDEDIDNPKQLAEQRRRHFLESSRSYIEDGKNVIICPEGACTTTEKSPLPFKVGAFRLASFVRPEPLIVPIVVANFDKKLTSATFVARVMKPIRLSDHVPQDADSQALCAFVNKLQEDYVGWVREAAAVERNASGSLASRT